MEKIFVFDLGNVIVRPMSIKKLYEMLKLRDKIPILIGSKE